MKDNTWIYSAIATLVFVFALLLYITPEQTNGGEFTDFFKYWLDNDYFTQNFLK